MTGSQPVLFVFAAGNAGNGDDTTDPGAARRTHCSPATAKNVITVGAIQEFRNITNQVTNADGTVSTPWQAETSTSYRIAGFSSRGNVGIGIEGTYGRFKPDVVAPGTFIVSTRSSQMGHQLVFLCQSNELQRIGFLPWSFGRMRWGWRISRCADQHRASHHPFGSQRRFAGILSPILPIYLGC